MHAYIARGVDLAIVNPILVEALSYARKEGNRFEQLRLLALTAWQQLQLDKATAATDKVLEAAYLAIETGYVRVLLDIPELMNLLKELDIPLILSEVKTEETTHSAMSKPGLTPQEQKVLKLLAAGYMYQQIADEMVISINTVRSHVRNIYRKLGAKRREEAIRKAFQLSWLPG